MPILLGALAVVVAAITLILILSNKKAPLPGAGITDNRTAGQLPTKKPFSPFGFLSNENKQEKPAVNTQDAIDKSLKNIHSGSPAAPIPTGIIKIQPNGTKASQAVGGSGTTQTSQGTISTQANIQTGVDSSTQADNIKIVFQNPDGSTFTYIPPGTPPDEVRWGRYTNIKAKYAINYPVNWQFVYAIDTSGNEQILLYPPTQDVNDPNSHYIAFGYSDSAFNPVNTNLSESYPTSIKVDGVPGTLYTNGEIGESSITSFLDYNSGSFGLMASKSDATFAYVYYYMLNSLTFNIQ